MLRSALCLLTLLCLAPAARAIELRIQFAALERMLGEQVFTQDGRRYVHNDQANKCNFAYLEKPRVQGQDGKLRMRARFSGRSALNMFGRCVGLGDAFEVIITALPPVDTRTARRVVRNLMVSSRLLQIGFGQSRRGRRPHLHRGFVIQSP